MALLFCFEIGNKRVAEHVETDIWRRDLDKRILQFNSFESISQEMPTNFSSVKHDLFWEMK